MAPGPFPRDGRLTKFRDDLLPSFPTPSERYAP